MQASFDQLSAHEKSFASATAVAGHDLVHRNKVIIVGSCLIATLLSVVFALLCARLIVRPLREASRLAQAMSKGDFTDQAAATSRDATGVVLTALGEVSQNLGHIVREIRTTVDGVNHASTEIANGSTNLSRRTESTASSLQQTAASLVQLTSTIQESASNAAQRERPCAPGEHGGQRRRCRSGRRRRRRCSKSTRRRRRSARSPR